MSLKILKFWFPVILYSVIIFYGSSIPKLETPIDVPFSDKIFHFVEYGVLGFLIVRAMTHAGPQDPISRRRMIWLAFLFCCFYGASDEFHQMFVVGRDAKLTDFLADSLGGFIGGLVYAR